MTDAIRDQNYITVALGVSSASSTTTLPFKIDSATGRLLTDNAGGGSGTVTEVSVVTANGFAGTVANATTTPAITITTTINSPVLAGNGTAISAATTTGSGSTVVLNNSPVFVDDITLGVTGSATGSILFKGTTSGTVTLKVADAAGTWTMTLPTTDGNSGEFLQTDGAGVLTWAAGSSGITIGTTTITSGTNTRILYNNSGVVGEYTLTGSGTVVVMATSPTLVTPVLGVATATSINKVAITAPATSATLTIADGKTLTASVTMTLQGGDASVLSIAASKTLTVSNTLTFTGTDSSSVAFGAGGTVLYTTSTVPLTVGSTTIASGTNTRILYNNSGVLGEYTLTGSGTVVVMQTAPTFVTSITTPSVLATANDSGALGASGTAFSDLFLASGAVINFAAGNMTITHGTGVLTFSPGILQLGENTSIALDPALSADGKYSGVTIAGTAGATLAFGDLVYLAAADSRWELADADAASTSDRMLGMCVLAAAADGDPTVILLQGNIRADAAFPTLTIGSAAYVGETAGDIQVAIPTGADNVIRRVGYALTADELYFNPSMDSQITVA